MSLGDVLDGGFQLFRATWQAALTLTAVLVVPYQLITSWLQREALSVSVVDIVADPFAAQELGTGSVAEQVGALLLNAAFFIVVWPVLVGALIHLGFSAYLGRPVAWRDALRGGARRAAPLIGTWALAGLAALVPFLVFVVLLFLAAAVGGAGAVVLVVLGFLVGLLGALAVLTLFATAAPAVVIERQGAVAALGRSWRLVRRRFWPVLGVLLVAMIVVSMISVALSGIPQLLAGFAGPFAWLVAAAGATAGSLVTTPLLAFVLLLVLLDLKIRIEGFDLALAAGAAGTAPQPGGRSWGAAGGPGR